MEVFFSLLLWKITESIELIPIDYWPEIKIHVHSEISEEKKDITKWMDFWQIFELKSIYRRDQILTFDTFLTSCCNFTCL